MEEKQSIKISLSTFFLILAIIAIIIMGFFIYKLNTDKSAEIKKSNDLQSQVSTLNGTVNNLQEQINTILINNTIKFSENEIKDVLQMCLNLQADKMRWC